MPVLSFTKMDSFGDFCRFHCSLYYFTEKKTVSHCPNVLKLGYVYKCDERQNRSHKWDVTAVWGGFFVQRDIYQHQWGYPLLFMAITHLRGRQKESKSEEKREREKDRGPITG